MSHINQKIRLPRAVKESNRFNLSCRNITTMDFYKLKPVYTRELVPKSKIEMNLGVFTRLSPLVKPAYAECNIISRAFFVPFRTVLDGWKEFIEDTSYKQTYPSVPTVSNANLIGAFIDNAPVVSSETSFYDDYFYNENYLAVKVSGTWRTASNADMVCSDANSTPDGLYMFTQLGKHCYDVLCNLGYGLNCVDYLNSDRYSLLPLFAYYKLFQDWYRNPQYDYAWPITFPISPNSIPSDIRALITEMLRSFRFAFYERDYFTAAWDNPNSPNSVPNYGRVTLPDVSLSARADAGKSAVFTDPNQGTPVLKGASATAYTNTAPNSITKYILDGLRLLTDYMKRHQLAGTQAMERYLAEWGIMLPDAKLDRSTYLGKAVTPVQISDIMNQTAPTDDNQPALGEYAGRGIGQGTGHFEFDCAEEFGQFFVVSVVVPKVMYVQGIDRALQHINRLDFFSPTFDGLGMQAIRIDELIGKRLNTPYTEDVDMAGVFGFTSRYAEYKVAQDRVTGDFLLHLEDETSDNARYHLARLLPTDVSIAHSLDFTRANPDQYNRIFADSNGDFDHFINVFFFNVTIQQPMSRMFDDYEFEEQDSGAPVTMPLGGVQKD